MGRWATIAAIVVLAGLLAVGLVGFFADPLHLPPQVLDVLDQRASVVSMFIGAAGLVVAVVALLLQVRAESAAAAPDVPGVPQTSPAESPLQRTASGGERRTYGGDHIEFHHNTFGGTVVGKQVTRPTPPAPSSMDGDSDDRG
ncbi:hypothetical protein AB0B54_30475 [Microbispora bryophytorum]|uniref:hypothetical protein n=1 Tax=Microbispora bryophytorum TaxID=1460882 RepID=UPI0033C66260